MNTLKARRWALSRQEEQKAKEIQALIIQQAALDDQIFLWEKEVDKLRNLEKLARVGFVFLSLLSGCTPINSYTQKCPDGSYYCFDFER